MSHVIALLLSLIVSDVDAEALRRTAPNDLTLETAREHLGAARFAGSITGVDPNLLLSVAWHESRYQPATVTPEISNRVSCGVLTPYPKATCSNQSLIEQYVDGAQHLREWISATKTSRVALLGYAGGYHLITTCKTGPVLIRKSVDACQTPRIFLDRAAWIERELRRWHAS